jgi:hypothetical protein
VPRRRNPAVPHLHAPPPLPNSAPVHSLTVPAPSSPGNGRAPRPPPSFNGGRWRARRPPPLHRLAYPSALYKRRAPPPNPSAPLPPLSSPARALPGASPEPEPRRPHLAADPLLWRLSFLFEQLSETPCLSSLFWCFFPVV